MSLTNKKPVTDIENIEHNDEAEMKKVVAFGKTTASTYVPILVDEDGKIQ